MGRKVYEESWGGRGEHGSSRIEYKVSTDEITVSFIVKEYNDWGRESQVQADYVKEKSYPLEGKMATRDFVYECIRRAAKDLRIYSGLPDSPQKLFM